MIAEDIEAIEALVKDALKVQEIEIDGRRYVDKELRPFKLPMDETVNVSTLTGLVGLLNGKIDSVDPSTCFVQIASPTFVKVAQRNCNDWGDRQYSIQAALPKYGAFPFGEYLEQERFLISARTFFKESGDLAYVLKIASCLKAENVATSDDDGHTQMAAVRQGAVLANVEAVKPLVTLQPWRTFREVAQPESTFLLRLKSRDGQVPSIALFQADGDVWQLDAMQRIHTYLTEALPGSLIVA